MNLIFLISVYSTFVYSGCCLNPYFGEDRYENADRVNEYSDIDTDGSFEKRAIDRNEVVHRDEDSREENNAVKRKRSVVKNMPGLGELNKMNDDDIAAALSRLSVGELDTLDRFIDEKVQVVSKFYLYFIFFILHSSFRKLVA